MVINVPPKHQTLPFQPLKDNLYPQGPLGFGNGTLHRAAEDAPAPELQISGIFFSSFLNVGRGTVSQRRPQP